MALERQVFVNDSSGNTKYKELADNARQNNPLNAQYQSWTELRKKKENDNPFYPQPVAEPVNQPDAEQEMMDEQARIEAEQRAAEEEARRAAEEQAKRDAELAAQVQEQETANILAPTVTTPEQTAPLVTYSTPQQQAKESMKTKAPTAPGEEAEEDEWYSPKWLDLPENEYLADAYNQSVQAWTDTGWPQEDAERNAMNALLDQIGTIPGTVEEPVYRTGGVMPDITGPRNGVQLGRESYGEQIRKDANEYAAAQRTGYEAEEGMLDAFNRSVQAWMDTGLSREEAVRNATRSLLEQTGNPLAFSAPATPVVDQGTPRQPTGNLLLDILPRGASEFMQDVLSGGKAGTGTPVDTSGIPYVNAKTPYITPVENRNTLVGSFPEYNTRQPNTSLTENIPSDVSLNTTLLNPFFRYNGTVPTALRNATEAILSNAVDMGTDVFRNAYNAGQNLQNNNVITNMQNAERLSDLAYLNGRIPEDIQNLDLTTRLPSSVRQQEEVLNEFENPSVGPQRERGSDLVMDEGERQAEETSVNPVSTETTENPFYARTESAGSPVSIDVELLPNETNPINTPQRERGSDLVFDEGQYEIEPNRSGEYRAEAQAPETSAIDDMFRMVPNILSDDLSLSEKRDYATTAQDVFEGLPDTMSLKDKWDYVNSWFLQNGQHFDYDGAVSGILPDKYAMPGFNEDGTPNLALQTILNENVYEIGEDGKPIVDEDGNVKYREKWKDDPLRILELYLDPIVRQGNARGEAVAPTQNGGAFRGLDNLPEEVRKLLATSNFYGAGSDNPEYFDGTDEEYNRLADLFLHYMPGLQTLIDRGFLSQEDIMNFFFKAPGSAKKTTKSSGGSGSNRQYYGGGGYMYGGGNYKQTYTPNPSVKLQNNERLYNIMKNWSF